MTNLVFVKLDDGMNTGSVVMTLKQVENLKKEVAENGDEDFFTFTYITNKEYLVLVKLGMDNRIAE